MDWRIGVAAILGLLLAMLLAMALASLGLGELRDWQRERVIDLRTALASAIRSIEAGHGRDAESGALAMWAADLNRSGDLRVLVGRYLEGGADGLTAPGAFSAFGRGLAALEAGHLAIVQLAVTGRPHAWAQALAATRSMRSSVEDFDDVLWTLDRQRQPMRTWLADRLRPRAERHIHVR